MNLRRRRIATVAVSSAVLTGLVLPTAALAAPPGPAPAQGVVTGQAGARAGKADVAVAILDITKKLIGIVTDAIERKQNRSGYVKSLMEGAFYEAGQRYNVMVINNANRHTAHLRGVVYDARISGIHGTYRVIVFESGTFTNHGDGGWINWAFRGWFDRDGGHVTFRRSW
ncbi:stress protein [Streptomyces sp. CC228A]|uniref:stress protein n=1 Tax=Streptomyces sp. CC228A TaxID=2898186 RepID=UPI001F15BFF5|nr:stress protein [Streptomyces sp. CC228A]